MEGKEGPGECRQWLLWQRVKGKMAWVQGQDVCWWWEITVRLFSHLQSGGHDPVNTFAPLAGASSDFRLLCKL